MKKLFTLLFIAIILQVNAQCWKKVDLGSSHSVGIKADGTLWYWGFLNNPCGTMTNTPRQIGNLANWKTVDAGASHCLALKNDGTLWAWGNNNEGQLGIGVTSTVCVTTPTQVGTDTDWNFIDAGINHSLAIKNNGTLWTWGNNSYRELGDGTNIDKNFPVQIGSSTNWKSVKGGKYYSIGIKTDGTLWAWGLNDYGQLGDGTLININTPTQIGSANNWQSILALYMSVSAIKTDGTLWAWGANSQGQLGDGTNVDKTSPVQIGSSNNWLEISTGSGFSHVLAIQKDSTLWAWGSNNYGQLGDATIIGKNSPVQIGSSTKWKTLSVGNSHSSAIMNNGTLYTWGNNMFGEIGNGTNGFGNYVNSPMVINCPTSIIGIKEFLSNEKYFSLSPNPATNFLNIKSSSNSKIDNIVISDIAGRKILEQKENTSRINIEILEQGMYQLLIISDGKNYTGKFIKE